MAGSEGPRCFLQAEILDESDIYEDVNRRLLRRDRERADIASYLAMFEHKLHATALSSSEVAAVSAYLVLNVEEFAPLLGPHDMPLKVCWTTRDRKMHISSQALQLGSP